MKNTIKAIILIICAALLALVIIKRPKDSTPAEMPAPVQSAEPTPAPTPEPAPTPTPTPAPDFDDTPQETDMAVTVNGMELSGVFKLNGVEYIKLYELLAAVKPGAQPELINDVSDHYAVNASCGNIGVYCENNSIDIYVGEYGSVMNANPWVLYASPLYDGMDWYVPLDACEALGYTRYDDAEMNHVYYTFIPTPEMIPAGRRVPVLMYHAISDECWGLEGLFVSPSEMDKQLQYLEDNGYTTIWFEDLPYIDQIEKPVILTFDDGYDDNYTELFPLLKKHNAKATIFVVTSRMGTGRFMTAEQAREMSESGLVSIQSHTSSHRELKWLDAAELDAELSLSVLEVTRITGKQPFVVCYPSGKYSDLAVEKVEEYFTFGTIIDGYTYVTGECRRGAIPRLRIPREMTVSGFAWTVDN